MDDRPEKSTGWGRRLNFSAAVAVSVFMAMSGVRAQEDPRGEHLDPRTEVTPPEHTQQGNSAHLEDDGEYFPHEHVLEAIHTRVYEAHPFYKEEPEHGPYELQADLHVKLATFSLDEHQADIAEVGLHHVDFLSGAVNDHLAEGSVMLGSHEGLWLDRLSAAGEHGQHLRADTGIVLARRITAVDKREDGSTQAMTEAVHPFHAFEEVHFKLDWTPTPKRKKQQQANKDGSGRHLGGLTDCGSNKDYESLAPYGIDVYERCIDVGYDFDLFNFNKAPECQLLLVVEEGTVDADERPGWVDGDADIFVKASIDGTFRFTSTKWDDMTPEWSRTLDMGCPDDENEQLILTMIEDDMLLFADDEVFSCAVSGWSGADPAATQYCQDPAGDSEIQYRIIFTESFDTRAIVPLYDLDELFAEHLETAGLPFDATIEGFGCEECYGKAGSTLKLQFGYSAEMVKYFLVSAEGEVDVHINLKAEDPAFALFYTATLLEDLVYTPFIHFGPYFQLAFKKKLDFELEITGSASGDAGVEFSVNADAEVGMEYSRASINSPGEWNAFANANWGYSVDVYNNLYDASMEMTAKLRTSAFLQAKFLGVVDIYTTVSRSPYQGVKFYEGSTPQFDLMVVETSSADMFQAGDYVNFEVIYEHAAVGESMVGYFELVNDCDNSTVVRIGEILVDVESASASLHFEWALPWDSSLVKAGECSESWRGQVHFSGQTLAVARTEETFGFDLYDESEGLFMTPANGETVPVDTEYDLTWDPTLLKYFVSGEGAALGSEDVSAQVQLYAVNSDSSVYNLTAEPVNNTGSFSTIFPSSHDTDTGWYMLIFSAENSAVWSWSPGWFILSSGSQRKLQLQDSTLNQEAEDIQDQPHHSSFPASKWPSSLSYFAEYGHAPSKRQDRYVVHSVQENRRRLDSTACMAFFNGQDAQNSLDKVTLGGYAFYENDAAAASIITPLTLGEESCSPVPAPTPDRTLSPTPSPTTPPPTNLPTPAPVRPRPTEAPLTPAPTRLRPTPVPLAAGDTPSPTTAVDLPPEWQNCDLDGNPSSYLNDTWCDPVLNNADCGYDGGDCCTASCTSSTFFDNCPENDDQCVDPALAPTPAPTLASPWLDCALAGHPATWLADSYCDVDLNNVDCGYDGGDCCTATCAPSELCSWGDSQCVDPAHAPTPAPSPAPTPAPTVPAAWQACDFVGLPTSWLSDAYCDVDLNNEDCGYDGGDCCSATCANGCSESDENCVDPDHAPWPDCDFGDAGSFSPLDVGDSVCNTNLNNEGCAYDGGDCCTSTCIDSPGQTCTQTDYFCVDPGHLATPAPTALVLSTPAPTISSEWPDCVLGGSLASAVGDGLCDASLNNEPCGYDGGDCCAATCLHRGVDQCTDGNAFCLDERYRYDCDFGAELSEIDLGDGYCDQELYTLPCDFDDGDCCMATCVSGPVYDCPESKDDYPHCDEEHSGEEDDSEERDDDFSRAFAQGPGSIMRLASLVSIGFGVARNLRPQ